MQKDKERQIAGQYLTKLICCSIYGDIPELKPDMCSWEQLWELAAWNHIESMTSPAIRKYPEKSSSEVFKRWKHALNKNVYRRVRFDMERETILEVLEKKGIACLPLKGILVAGYYPEAGMRWMCDNDILYGYVEKNEAGGWKLRGKNASEQEIWTERARQELVTVMADLGYKVKSLQGNHDCFYKAPFFNFEMHRSLVNTFSDLADYYCNPWEKVVAVSEGCSLYRFSDEDEYLYLVSHAWKHFKSSGCGIRTLVDEYMILQNKANMDWRYIQQELKKMGITDFEKKLRRTAVNIFSKKKQSDEKDWELVMYMLGCGTYGTRLNRIQMRMAEHEGSKIGYLMERIRTDENRMKEFYPFFYRHKILRGVLPIYRILRGICVHPGKLIMEWKVVNEYQSRKRSGE